MNRSSVLASLFLLCCTPAAVSPAGAGTLISEFMAANETVLADQDGEFEDWLEVHHRGPGALDLGGYFLTDDPGDLRKWRFPATPMAEGAHLVVFASSKDRAVSGAELHTNFKLDADGDYLALVAPDGTTVVSDFAPLFPEQYPDVSYGHQTEGDNPTLRAGRPGFLIRHTPAAANTVIPGPHPLYCDDSLARVEITASQAVWNELQGGSPDWPEGTVDFRFRHGDIDVTVTNVGIRGRGNTGLTKYPRSFRISFDSFVPGQDLYGIEKLNLNAEANDPSTARSKLGFDLAAAAGLPSEYANHVATVIHGPDNHRSGPDGTFFDAVLNNTQPVDDVFVKQRFENTRGNLYKCVYTGDGPATLVYRGPTGSSYAGLSTYELKYQGSADGSFDDLARFIDVLNNTPAAEFAATIRRHFAVDDFLRRLALDVLTSNWDGYWGNWNNFYLYRDPGSGLWHYIPYDLDNTFSIRWIAPPSGDWATQDMYAWGKSHNVPLVTRILAVDEFRHRYSYYMSQMVQTFYRNDVLDPLVYRIRTNHTAALAFGGLGVSNCKEAERDRYRGDWPGWDYGNYFYSFDYPQNKVPNYYGITQFVAARRAGTLGQLNLVNIGPLVSDLELEPALPRTNDAVRVTARIQDDVQVSAVTFHYTFEGGPAMTAAMTDDESGADPVAGDGMYTVELAPFGVAGDLDYYLQAVDNQGKATREPWDGAAASVEIGSPYLHLAIAEIHYHPPDPEGAELGVNTNGYAYEFIELLNRGSTPLELEGLAFIAGVSYTFPAGTLAAGERVVVVKDTAAFEARYGSGANLSGAYQGKLANQGETLRLVDPAGVTLIEFAYRDTPPWPRRPDGFGSSLERVDSAAGGPGDASSWRASVNYGGSPGHAGSVLPPTVVINEVLTHTDPPLVDTIELYNPTDAAVGIGGWFLSDAEERYRKYRMPGGTVLPAGSYITLNETNHFNVSQETDPADFALDSSRGDQLWLLAADGESNLLAFVDHVDFEAAANGESFGRWPNGTGDLYPMLERSLGTSNTGPRVGPVIIGEFMYQAPTGDRNLEFVELYNAGTAAEDLTGWALTGDADFAFPSNTLLDPGEVLVVLPFDPVLPAHAGVLADFLSHYGIAPGDGALTGPYLGSLSDTGDTVRVRRADDPPAEEPGFVPMLLEDEVRYLPSAPWPNDAAGGGAALARTGPTAWGNDPGSWMTVRPPVCSPGAAPGRDGDGDGIPDDYELYRYGDTGIVGSSDGSDADGDGLDDQSEYVAGTSATNAQSHLALDVGRDAGGVRAAFPTQPVEGPGYFGLQRHYGVEWSSRSGSPDAWIPVPGYQGIAATGDPVALRIDGTNRTGSVRVRVTLE